MMTVDEALKEAQEQEPVAWLCGKGVTTHKAYAEWFMRFTQEDCTPLYAAPVPAAPAVAVPAVPTDEQIHAAYRKALGQSIRERDMPEIRKFARALLQSAPQQAAPSVPQEWRDVITELADDLSIELDQRYGDSRKYPSEQRKYEAEMQPVYRARALLQSTGDKK